MVSKTIRYRERHSSRWVRLLIGALSRLRFGIPVLVLAASLALIVYSPCNAGFGQPPGGSLQLSPSNNQGSDQTGLQPPTAASDNPEQDGDEQPFGPPVRQTHSKSEYQFDYYRDSGGNRVSTFTTLTDVSIGKATFTLRREKVTASGLQGDEGSEATVVSGYGKPWKWLLVGGGIGVIRTEDGSSSLAGSLISTFNLKSMSLTLGASRCLLEANAQTIANHVMQTDLNVSIWNDFTDHLGADVEFYHRMFSDGNSENDFSLAPEYSLNISKTRLALGWSLEYANFARPTTLGYYAPQGLLSNQPTISWKFDRVGYYGLLKVGVGRTFWLYQTQWTLAFAGTGVAAFGKRLSERAQAEWYLTAGRDALGVPSTWSSMNMGLKLNYSF